MNIKDKILRNVLFGRDANFNNDLSGRSKNIQFGIAKDGDKFRSYNYRNDDGFILTLIEMIEKLEEKVAILEKTKITINKIKK